MPSNHNLTVRRTSASHGRDRRRLHRTARRHSRLTLSDRIAYWQAVRGARTGRRVAGRLWPRLAVALVIVSAGLAAGAFLI